jgi:hypothetical protein
MLAVPALGSESKAVALHNYNAFPLSHRLGNETPVSVRATARHDAVLVTTPRVRQFGCYSEAQESVLRDKSRDVASSSCRYGIYSCASLRRHYSLLQPNVESV